MADDTDDRVEERTVAGRRVRILRDSCIGTGACVKEAPEVFVLDDRQVVTFTEDAGQGPGQAPIETDRLEDAVRSCPVFALEIAD
jgi:ferredoxin